MPSLTSSFLPFNVILAENRTISRKRQSFKDFFLVEERLSLSFMQSWILRFHKNKIFESEFCIPHLLHRREGAAIPPAPLPKSSGHHEEIQDQRAAAGEGVGTKCSKFPCLGSLVIDAVHSPDGWTQFRVQCVSVGGKNEERELSRSEVVRYKYNTMIRVIMDNIIHNGSERKRLLPLVRVKGSLHGGDSGKLRLRE